MADNLKQYPRGQMKMAGDLVQVTDATFRLTNNAKLMHTLRKSPSGISVGNKESSFDFTAIIDEDGPERDWEELAFKGEIKTFQFIKPAADASVVVGVISQIEISMPNGEPVSIRGTGVGAFVE